MSQTSKPIIVFGAGSWGTALANLLASNGSKVHLWARDLNLCETMTRTFCNSVYLPDFKLNPKISFFSDLNKVNELEADHLFAVPSHAIGSLLEKLQAQGTKVENVCWAIKGVETSTEQLISDRFQYYFPHCQMAMLAGPSFAKEVIAKSPTAVAVASDHIAYAHYWANLLGNHYFRVYCSGDLITAQIAGTMKNVLAIACGIADGLGFGANTRAALITRGLSEITRLGIAMGADEKSFSGLAAMGDLILTCTDNQSRNRRFGLLIGQGETIHEASKQIGQVVEGFYNTQQVLRLAANYNIELPICQEVALVLDEKKSPQSAAEDLLNRMPAILPSGSL